MYEIRYYFLIFVLRTNYSDMENLHSVTTLGYILKKEELATLATELKLSELILEDLDQFPGLYDHYFVPGSEKEMLPRSLFLILKEYDVCQEDAFLRKIKQIKAETEIVFDAVLGNVNVYNKTTPCIRIYMDHYNELPALLEELKKRDFKFQSAQHIKPYHSIIKLRKFFNLKQVEPGIYFDVDQKGHWYIEVPKFISWDDFEKVTPIVRNNISFKQYDAAQAAIYRDRGIVELVRIFSLVATAEDCRLIKARYAAEISSM